MKINNIIINEYLIKGNYEITTEGSSTFLLFDKTLNRAIEVFDTKQKLNNFILKEVCTKIINDKAKDNKSMDIQTVYVRGLNFTQVTEEEFEKILKFVYECNSTKVFQVVLSNKKLLQVSYCYDACDTNKSYCLSIKIKRKDC